MTREECKAVGPKRTLWGNRVNMICTLAKGHSGDHCDQAITGYSVGNWWAATKETTR